MIDVNLHASTEARASVPSQRTLLLFFALFASLVVLAYGHLLNRLLYGVLHDELSWQLTNRDFANYWTAGRLVLAGEQQQLFALETYFPHMQEVFGSDYPIHNWGYPPHSLLLLWPLGLLQYRPALLLFLGVSFTLFLAAVMTFRREYAPTSSPWLLAAALIGYLVMMVHATQNGFLSAAALIFGLATMKRRPMLAGLAFGLLTIKPQLGVLIPILLLFERNWRTIVWSALFTVTLVGLSLICFGVESWHAYLTDTLTYQHHVATEWSGPFLAMMPTIFGSLRAIEVPAGLAAQVQGPVSIIVAAAALWVLRRQSDPLRRSFVVASATMLVTPYAFDYDMGALSVVAALVAISGSLRSRAATMAVSLVAVVPGLVMPLGESNLPITPLILIAGFWAVVLDAWKYPLREGILHKGERGRS
jgi:hypothetical protein